MDEAAAKNEETPVIEMAGVATAALVDPETTVLEDVHWRVMAGEYWVVAGMHGSGKSDLMAMTAGLMPPQGGSYRLFGHEMPMYDEELLPERLRLGLVFDGGHLFHHLSVVDNIALPLRYHRELDPEEAARRVEAVLELTELKPWADVRPGRLGSNWQKRVGLARALVLEPEVLLVDDPLSGLDLRHGGWWLNFLGRLSAGDGFPAGRRLTLVVTTEDLRPWQERASDFALLKNRRLKLLGRQGSLAGHSEPLVKELLAENYTGS
jgi:ABC-type transporter Mla maintaining outer membrane lipid asymmetry ATPase subunit MlaF